MFLGKLLGLSDTRLIKAVIAEDDERATSLIENGASLDTKDADGKSALWHAINYKNTAIAKALLEKGADPYIVDNENDGVLWLACLSYEGIDILPQLLEYNFDSATKNKALLAASGNVTAENTRLLLEHGADVNTTDEDGRTALFQLKSCAGVASVLIEYGIDVNAKDNDGLTAVEYLKSLNAGFVSVLGDVGLSAPCAFVNEEVIALVESKTR